MSINSLLNIFVTKQNRTNNVVSRLIIADRKIQIQLIGIMNKKRFCIDDSGIFELPGNKFSKLYKLSDIYFPGVTDEEKKGIIIAFSKIIKTIPCRFSYSI